MHRLPHLAQGMTLSLAMCVANVALVHASPQSLPAPMVVAAGATSDGDNDIHTYDVSPAERAKLRGDAAAAKAASKSSTPAERAAAAAAKRTDGAVERYPDNDIHANDPSAAQSAQERREAADAKAARNARTQAQKRALRTEKQKQTDVLEKSGPGS